MVTPGVLERLWSALVGAPWLTSSGGSTSMETLTSPKSCSYRPAEITAVPIRATSGESETLRVRLPVQGSRFSVHSRYPTYLTRRVPPSLELRLRLNAPSMLVETVLPASMTTAPGKLSPVAASVTVPAMLGACWACSMEMLPMQRTRVDKRQRQRQGAVLRGGVPGMDIASNVNPSRPLAKCLFRAWCTGPLWRHVL